MASVLARLIEKREIDAPLWLKDNICFEAMSGSVAYGVSKDSSDKDYTGFCIPPKSDVFYDNELPHFGKPRDRFAQYQKHQFKYNGDVYDFNCYSISKYFHLCMDCNPNMMETLFYPVDVTTHSTQIHQIVKDNRHLFLHKGAYHRLKGYAYSQMSKALSVSKDADIIRIREFEEKHNIPHDTTFEQIKNHLFFDTYTQCFNVLDIDVLKEYYDMFKHGLEKTKRFESQKIHNADTKFLYHLARLTNYCRQILETHTLDVRQDREYWKAIRKGEVSTTVLQQKFEEEERQLQKLYETSTLRKFPEEQSIKTVLFQCLEHHYGNIPVQIEDHYKLALMKISDIISKTKF